MPRYNQIANKHQLILGSGVIKTHCRNKMPAAQEQTLKIGIGF